MAAEHNRMANRIQLRRDTTANWNSVNPVLADGEMGYDIVTNEIRIGNGSNTWSQLSGNTISGGGGASTGNVTFSDINVIGTSSLRLQPNVALDQSYIDIYLTSGPDIHIDTYSANLILGQDGSANVRLSTDGNVQIRAEDGGSTSTWTFDPDGNVTLPQGSVISEVPANSSQGILLTPKVQSGENPDMAVKIYPTFNDDDHVHITAGNPSTVDLFLGDDDQYVKIEKNAGNIVIGTNNNTHNWTFDTTGNLTFPTGNLVITPDDPAGNVAYIASTDHPLGMRSTGANGAVATFWIEDYANLNTSNIAAVYANPTPGSKIVRIAVGQNGSPGPNLWDFGADGTLTAPGTITSLSLAVGEAYSATPVLTSVEIEEGLPSRLMRMTGNLSTYGNEIGTGIEILAYRESPANDQVGPTFVLRQSTADSPDSVVAEIYSTVTNVSIGNVSSTLSFSVKNNDAYANTLVVSGTGINVTGNVTVGNLLLSAGGEIYSESGTGNVVIETNDGNNVRSWTFTGNGVIQNPVLTIGTLPSASPAGQRAFVSDGADTAVTWSVAVSATGSNTYPVWSDGIVWRYG
jgi:hypothetical protein